MSEATLARAFEPFLQPRRLAAVLGWAYQWGKSSPRVGGSGAGEELPRKAQQVESWLPPAERQSKASVLAEPGEFVFRQRQARILVCDDDKDVCSLVGTLLRDCHTVWEVPQPALA